MLEVGTIGASNSRSIIFKNMIDTFISALAFYVIGYAYAYGDEAGLLGSGQYFDTGFKDEDYRKWVIAFCFCSTTCTAVSGALAERTYLDTYRFFTLIMSSLVYPVISCWVWGGGWLQRMGYHDHGGSGVVHMTAGCAAMIGAFILGPRLGFSARKASSRKNFQNTRDWLERYESSLAKMEKRLE